MKRKKLELRKMTIRHLDTAFTRQVYGGKPILGPIPVTEECTPGTNGCNPPLTQPNTLDCPFSTPCTGGAVKVGI